MGLRAARMEREEGGLTMAKIAFCFPGQGSLEAGMGRDIAEAVPEAMEVYEIASEAYPATTSSGGYCICGRSIRSMS